MSSYVTEFLLPTLSLLTTIFILAGLWIMFSQRKHEEKSDVRHMESVQYSRSMHDTLKKVDKKISEEVIPKIEAIYTEKSENIISLTPKEIMSAIERIGASPSALSEDDELILVGWEYQDQKVYFVIKIDLEANDLMIEGYSNRVFELDEEMLVFLLKYNEEMKVSGVCIEELEEVRLLKTQHLVDAPDGSIHYKTLDFVMISLMESQIEIKKELDRRNLRYEFFPPEEYFPLAFRSSASNTDLLGR